MEKRKKPIEKKNPSVTPIGTTLVFYLNRTSNAQIVLNRGGARSSKSYSITQLLIEWFFTIPKIKILMLRKWQPSLRLSVKPLVWEIIDSYNLRHKVTEVKQDMNLWSHRKGLIHMGGLDEPEKIKCFHPDTEILTQDGFRSITEVKKGDVVISVHPETFQANYYPISEMHEYYYKGVMVSPSSETGKRFPYTNFSVTPEHNMLVYSKRSLKYKHREGRVGCWRFKKAGNLPLYNDDYSIPVSCKWDVGGVPDFYEIPRVDWNEMKGGEKNKNGKKTTVFPIIPWLKFFGWYISEGCVDGDKTVNISQKKGAGVVQLLDDLKDFPIKYKYSEKFGYANLYSKDLVAYLKQFGDCYSKFIPRKILNLHPSLLKHLFNALIAGDGRRESNIRLSYSTSSKQLADDICEIGIKLGYSVSVRENEAKFTYKGVLKKGHLYWMISFIEKEKASIVKTTRIPYEGMVYCPTVEPYHTVVTRHKGKVIISGQSSDWNIIWMEEATEFTYEDFVTLKLRLSTPTYEFMRNKIFLSFNPIDEYHWIKTKIVDEKTEDFVDIHSNYLYNPFLARDYVQTIEMIQYQDPNYWRIFGEGEWGKLENVIYNNWSIVPYLPEGEKIFGLDFGFVNPTALVQLNVDGFEVGVQQKIYRTGLTNQDLIRELHSIMTKEEKEQCPIYADSAEPQRIEELNREGFWVIPANKSVKDGIDYVKRCRMRITNDSDNIIKEIRGYSHKTDKNGRVLEEPVKFNDHGLDAIRYGLHTHALRNIRRSNIVKIAPSLGEVESFADEETIKRNMRKSWLSDRN